MSGSNLPDYCVGSCAMTYDANGNMTARGTDVLVYDSENRLQEVTVYRGSEGEHEFTLEEDWNVISFTFLPEDKSVENVLGDLEFGVDYDQVSTWDESTDTWLHWVNDSDFNDFTEFEAGKTYEIHVIASGGAEFSVSGASLAVDIEYAIIEGDNFISPAVQEPENIAALLTAWSLSLGTDISDIKRFNASTQTLESYAESDFTTFEPGKGYIIVGLQEGSFSYGAAPQETSMVYDASGARVKKIANGATTKYFGKDYEVEGSTSTKHIFLGDERITTKDSTGNISFIHSDHINSSNVITDADGEQAGLYEYDPYGLTVTHTGSAELKHKFTGQEEDTSTGLYNYNARYYDPELGRFITADAYVQNSEDPQFLNRYSYARNNPLKYTDPTGNFAWIPLVIGIAKAAAIGAAVGATLGVLDAAVSGRPIGEAAVSGAVSGAIGGAVSGLAGPALAGIGDALGQAYGAAVERIFTIGVDISKVGMSGVHVYRNISNQEYFSLAFNSIGVVAGVEELVGNRVVEHVEAKAAKSGVSLKNAKPVKGKPGVFEATGNADVFNPNSQDFKTNLYGQIKGNGVFTGDHHGAQKRFWGLHVHDFKMDKAGRVMSFKFHYDPGSVASPIFTGVVLHGLDFLQYKADGQHIDKSNSYSRSVIESQRTRIK